MAGKIEPEQIVEANRIDHKRIALPVADGVAVPGGVRVFGMLAAIHEDLPEAMNVSFEKEEKAAWSRGNRPRIRSHTRDTGGQAISLGVIACFARFHSGFPFRLE